MDVGSSTDRTYRNDGVPPPFSPDIPGLGSGNNDNGGGYVDPGTSGGDTGVTDPGNPPPFSPDIPGLGDGTGNDPWGASGLGYADLGGGAGGFSFGDVAELAAE